MKPYCASRSILLLSLLRLAMQIAIVLLWCGLAVVLLAGCAASRTVFIPESSPIRMGPSVSGRVYTMIDGQWTLSSNRVEIPEGWYCVPPSYVAEED